jgi:hypothetical protein
MPTLIFKNEQQLGPFEDFEILASLQSGEYSYGDLAWRQGMTAWEPLHLLYPMEPPPVPGTPQAAQPPITSEVNTATGPGVSRAISFGTWSKVDGFGFVRSGEIKITPSNVEFSGSRHWNAVVRTLLFLVGWAVSSVLFWGFFGGFGGAMGGVLGSIVTISCGNPITAGVVTLWIIHIGCASRAAVTIEKSKITAITRSGTIFTLQAPDPKTGTLRKAVFRAGSTHAAEEIQHDLTE